MSKRPMISCRGWTYAGHVSSAGIDVTIAGVCCCRRRQRCRGSGRCERLFEDGGSLGRDRVLDQLMRQTTGKPMPRSWREDLANRKYLSQRVYNAKYDAIAMFERTYFRHCKPVWIVLRTARYAATKRK